MVHNIAYWITRKEYDYPLSDTWENVLFIMFPGIEYHIDFNEHVDSVSDSIKEEKPAHYAIITDTTDVKELEYIYRKFTTNSVIVLNDKYDKDDVGKNINWIMSDFGIERKKGNDTWFISDTHFNHGNIIKYCNRPWHGENSQTGDLIVRDSDVEMMNEEIIKNWNSVVGKEDIVWHLGDFCLGRNQKETIPEFVSKLNGKINLIMGNHDCHSVKFYYDAGFHRVYDRKVIINDFVVLSHAPMEFIKEPFFNIYGHVHDCETYKTWSKNSCCVCVERHLYKPVSWKEIKKRYDEQN